MGTGHVWALKCSFYVENTGTPVGQQGSGQAHDLITLSVYSLIYLLNICPVLKEKHWANISAPADGEKFMLVREFQDDAIRVPKKCASKPAESRVRLPHPTREVCRRLEKKKFP